MPEWVGWITGIAGVVLYVRAWTSNYDTRAHAIEALKEVENLRREIGKIWTRCGMLEGYVDTMTEHIIENDPLPQHYSPGTQAAKDWQKWRKEQLAQSSRP